MTYIFKDILKKETILELLFKNKYLKKIILFLISKKNIVRLAVIGFVAVLSVFITVLSVGITFGFNVKYSGRVIATIKNESVLSSAKDIVLNNVNSDNVDSALESPKLTLTLASDKKFDSAVVVADAIIENSNEIVKASALTVNGQMVACVKSDNLDKYLENACNKYNIDGAENSSFFVDDVTVTSGYYLKSEIDDISEAEKAIDELQIKTVAKVYTDTEIPFDSKTVSTNTQLRGYSEITVEGKNGLIRNEDKVERINGQEVSRTLIKSETISEPVTEVTTVGTAKTIASASDFKAASESGFIFPLGKASYTVSAYYGDGRGHKGVDLACKAGTNIYSVSDGEVVFSGFDGQYGYTVLIKHSNGYTTRYAHASSLFVNKGDIVQQGECIAAVGCTGLATGNHLHFEVLINNGNVDPAPYLGIR